jgi:hypothetical protein
MGNLDQTIIVVENWLDDLCINCMPNKNKRDYLKIEGSLVDDNYLFIEKKKIEKLNVNGD